MVTAEVRTPDVLWAQRKDVVYVTVNVADMQQERVEVADGTHFKFSANAGDLQYAVDMELYAAVDAVAVKQIKTGQHLSLIFEKVDKEQPYWPRLLAAAGKHRWLKTDFSKWRDEDDDGEDEAEPLQPPFNMNSEMFQNAGGGNPFGNMMDMSQLMQQAQGSAAGDEADEIDSDDELPIEHVY